METHFHELTALANRFKGIKNYNVAVREWKDKIIFMHKIVPGGSDDSYGIYVAKLAGIPESVIGTLMRAEDSFAEQGSTREPGRCGGFDEIVTTLAKVRVSPHLPSVGLHLATCLFRRCAYPYGHVK